jgi:multiple sugar transport system permease protein
MRRKKPQSRKRIFNKTALLFLLPAGITVLFVTVYPIAYGIYTGFTNRLFSYENYSFTGLDNYVAIFHDPVFYRSLWNSLIMVSYSTVFDICIGFGLALMLNSSEKYNRFFRVVFFLPWVLPSTVVAYAFRWLYNSDYGLINHLLVKYHIISTAVNPLTRESLVWLGVVIPNVWYSYPVIMLVLAAALKSIDRNVIEAAMIDGAGRWNIFREITLPALKLTIIMLVVLQIIWEFAAFDLIYLMTRGGPANATLTLSLYIFKKAFDYKRMGYACALATIMFLIMLLFIALYYRISKSGDNNEA